MAEAKPQLCPACALIFHTPHDKGNEGCECRHADCGCRRRRESHAR